VSRVGCIKYSLLSNAYEVKFVHDSSDSVFCLTLIFSFINKAEVHIIVKVMQFMVHDIENDDASSS